MTSAGQTAEESGDIRESLSGLLYSQFALLTPGSLDSLREQARRAEQEAEEQARLLAEQLSYRPTRAISAPRLAAENGAGYGMDETPTEEEMRQLAEAQDRVATLEAENAGLRAQIEALEAQLLRRLADAPPPGAAAPSAAPSAAPPPGPQMAAVPELGSAPAAAAPTATWLTDVEPQRANDEHVRQPGEPQRADAPIGVSWH